MVANVGNVYGKVIRDGPLNAQRPSANVGQTQLRIHGLRIARCGVCQHNQTVAALEPKDAGREDAATSRGPTANTGGGLGLPTCTEAATARNADAEYAHVARTRRRNAIHDNRSPRGDLVQP